MRILHLVHRAWPYHGGAERYVLEHAAAAERYGHSSVIATTDAWDMSWLVSRKGRRLRRREDVHRNVRIVRFPVVHPPLQNLFRAALRRMCSCGEDRFFYPNPFIPSLNRWLRKQEGFDIVHANAMPLMLHAGWRASQRHRAGLVTVPHANVGEKYRRVQALHYFKGCQKRIFRESNFTVAQSDFEADLLNEMGVPRERIHVSGSGIDPKEFEGVDGTEARRRLGLRGRIILSLTAHCRDRGILHMLEAHERLRSEGAEVTLVLAGPLLKDAEAILDSHIRNSTGHGEGLAVTGYVSQEERLDLLQASEMVLLPSRLDCFGIVLLEAWMLGKPVVGCWSGAMPDIIEDGRNGFLVPYGDGATLLHRIRYLLRNPEIASGMGSDGRKTVLQEHTWERVTDRFYRRLAQSCPSRSKQ